MKIRGGCFHSAMGLMGALQERPWGCVGAGWALWEEMASLDDTASPVHTHSASETMQVENPQITEWVVRS